MNNTRSAWPPKAPQPTAKLTEAALRMLSCPACDENVWKGEAIAFDEFEQYYKDLDEDAWKIAWKINYMKRLNSVADAAWANHLNRMDQEERSCLTLLNWDTDNNDQEPRAEEEDLFDMKKPPLYRHTTTNGK